MATVSESKSRRGAHICGMNGSINPDVTVDRKQAVGLGWFLKIDKFFDTPPLKGGTLSVGPASRLTSQEWNVAQ